MTTKDAREMDDVIGRQVVRSMAHNKTHIADVPSVARAVMFGSTYWMPSPETQTYCEVPIKDGVVMQPGTKVWCSACRVIDRYKAEHSWTRPNVPEPRDGVDGFRIPTWAPGAGTGEALARVREAATLPMDLACWAAAAATAVEIAPLADRLSELVASPDLRARLGAAGRERARAVYDWPVVYARHQALWAEQDARRRRASEAETSRLAAALRERGLSVKGGGAIKTLYYISPQIWAWKPKRRFTMARDLDALAVIFPIAHK